MRILLRLSFSMVLLLSAAGAAELWARSWATEKPWRKTWINTLDRFGHCYSRDPGQRMPLDLRSKADPVGWLYANALARAASTGAGPPDASKLALVAAETPHCILYSMKRHKGFRQRAPRTVLLFGDSFTFGEGLRDDETLGYLLTRRFEQTNFPNFGAPGVDVGAVAEALAEPLRRPHASLKLLIYFYNPNDASGLDEVMTPDSLIMDPEQLARERRLVPGAALLEWSRLFRVLHATLWRQQVSREYLDGMVSYYGSAAMGRTRGFLARMGAAARDAGIPLLVVIYPFMYHDLWGRYPLKAAHSWVLETCKQLGLRCLDGHEAFRDERTLHGYQLNPADAHPNLAANRRMVGWLEPHLGAILQTAEGTPPPRPTP